jgi:Flp pilus assembly pilin Flp
MRFVQFVKEFHNEESGQDLIEYVLVVAAVAVGAVAGSGTLSNTLKNAINTMSTKIQNCITTTGATC